MRAVVMLLRATDEQIKNENFLLVFLVFTRLANQFKPNLEYLLLEFEKPKVIG